MTTPNPIPRARFLKLLMAGVVFAPALGSLGIGADRLRGDRVGWARLKTSSGPWNRHSDSDPILMQFFRRQTSLNIDPTWYVADPQSLSELAKYPLLFAQSVSMVTSRSAQDNIAEYIRRGGFLLIDACCNRDINPSFTVFYNEQIEFLKQVLPETKTVPLPSTHEIYRCCFEIPNGRPPHTFFNNVYDSQKAAFGLYGIMIDSRMAGVISLSGLQCGWARMIAPQGHDVACMRMLVNIYTYAMMQGGPTVKVK